MNRPYYDMDNYRFRRTAENFYPKRYKRNPDHAVGIAAIIIGVVLFLGVAMGWL